MIFLDDDFMDPSKAEEILNLRVEKAFYFKKSFYDFDFSTAEGVISFLFLLPIVDEAILKQACAEVWPGSLTDPFDAKRARLELKGFFTDLLHSGVLVLDEVEDEAAVAATAEVQALDESADETAEGGGEGTDEGDEETEGDTDGNQDA